MKKVLTGLIAMILVSAGLMAKDVSSYLYADYKSAGDVKQSLQTNGFEVVGEYDAMGDAKYHIVVFTDDAMKNQASKKNRGFAAVQKVLISDNDKKLIITNPEYFLHAFMQDDYKEDVASSISSKLAFAFGTLEPSADALDDDDIAGYHFMMGMPYYEDMIEIGKGENLLSKIQEKAGDNVVFTLKLKNSTLVGVAMTGKDGESSYIPEIKGQKHSAFLPYMILIEDNTAKILHAKYYLAISYPKLSMGDFMGISSTPGNIEDYMSALVK